MQPIQVPVTFDRASRRKDKSVALTFTTNLEITTEDYMEMDRRLHEIGWLMFAPNEVQANQVPDVPADEAFGNMSPSQEMRWHFKKLWEQGPRDIDWPEFYRNRMARLNEALREKRNDK